MSLDTSICYILSSIHQFIFLFKRVIRSQVLFATNKQHSSFIVTFQSRWIEGYIMFLDESLELYPKERRHVGIMNMYDVDMKDHWKIQPLLMLYGSIQEVVVLMQMHVQWIQMDEGEQEKVYFLFVNRGLITHSLHQHRYYVEYTSILCS